MVYIDVGLCNGALAEVYLISTIQMQFRFEMIDMNSAVSFVLRDWIYDLHNSSQNFTDSLTDESTSGSISNFNYVFENFAKD